MATYYVDMAVGDDGNLGTSEGAGNAWKTIDKAMNEVAAGDKVWVKGSADYTELATIDTAGTNIAPIVFEGYTSATGDGGKATIDGGSARANCVAGPGGNSDIFYVFRNFIFENATADGVGCAANDIMTFKNCEFNNNGSEGCRVRNTVFYERCIAGGNAHAGLYSGGSGNAVIGCYSHTNTTEGFYGAGESLVAHSVFYSNGSDAIYIGATTSAACAVINCTVDGDGKDTLDGFSPANAAVVHWLAANNIFYDCTTGIAAGRDVGELAVSLNNLVNANTADYANAETFSGEQTGAPAFVTEGSDYRLQTSSPAKAAGIDAGVPIGDGSSYIDIGGIQREEAGAGGGGMLVHPGTSGGARG